MASEAPENAFGQQGGTPAWGADGWNGVAENQNSHIEHSDQHIQEPTISIDQAPHSPSDAASNDEDGGEYDPESVPITTTSAPAPAPAPVPAPTVERSASASSFRPSKKPKTTGGFIVDSSDDEYDAPSQNPTPAPNGLKPAPAVAQSFPSSHSPLQQTTPSQDTTSHPLAAQASNGPAAAAVPPNVAATAASRSRLPTDTVGILEDRIKDDPRGDLEAWLALINEHKRRHKIEDTRAAYERFLKVFPQAAEVWVAYIDMELSLENYSQAEEIFGRTLLSIPHVQLWTSYLNYIRRRNDLNDPSNRARQTVTQAYEFVLSTIGQDRDAGGIWQDYIQFVKTSPGQIGGNGWQDQQKMDNLRKAYQRAICIPMANLNFLWKEYDQFELSLNKMTGRKFLQERSPSYMTARSANTHLENITRGLQRTTLSRLPPAPGFDGEQEYIEQVNLWKAWIAWEKDDPLVLKADDPETYRQRILHVYKQALMALRFWPEMWVDAAEWCFENNVVGRDGQDLGLQFLVDGAAANPESSLLALKHADRIESTQSADEDDVGKVALAQAVRAPYDKVLDTLYGMVKRLKDQEVAAIAKIEEDATINDGTAASPGLDDDEDDEGEIKEKSSAENTKKDKIKAVQDGFAVQIQMLSQQISYLWVALARAFRRLQGQGQAKSTPPSGVRGIFTEARQKGRLTSDVYLAIAQIEWDIYEDNVGTKIFDRGAKLFPEQEHFIVEYLKHLHTRRDFTNARVVFSQAVQRFKEKPGLIPRLKPLYAYFHGYEAKFGELSQVRELERQMAELFPEDPKVAHFAARFSTDKFNPVTARVIISPAKQMRPKTVMQSVEQPSTSLRSSPRPAAQNERSPGPQFVPAVPSPKRPFQGDDQDDMNPPRKLARGASPLKGAAGRRLDQQRRAQHHQGSSIHTSNQSSIPSDINFLLSVIPNAKHFHDHYLNPDNVVRLVKETSIPDSRDWKAQHDVPQPRAHTRQASIEYPAFGYTGRDSPSVSGRPASPFGGINRVPPQASAPYRNSPLRPGSSGSYEPPPAVYQAPGSIQFAAMPQNPAPETAGYPGWQGGYAPTPGQYGLPPHQQAPQYGGYY
ncbi:hypothetical protein F4779DRAFT_597688 [Xylariaceae sp. FL0662B]|nr:hypothetical protein F4779DRAFT_597688 [Xylariaceae sp. FL0662B]